jgi:myosin heavy subunit
MPAKPAVKVDLSTIKVPVWAKPKKAVWVQENNPETNEPINFMEAIIDDIDETNKTIKITYVGKIKGPPEVLANLVTERSEVP